VGVRKRTLMVLLVFTLVLLSFPQIGLVNAQSNSIFIRADGTVDGTDKIQRNGNIYIFTDNINGSIIVEKNNVVIDGANYFLQGDGSEVGIKLFDDNTGITIRNLQIMHFQPGIVLSNASYTTIDSNIIVDNSEGIRITSGFNNKIIGNTIANNSENGVGIWFNTRYNNISGNLITNNWCGVFFHLYCADNILFENIITSNNGMGIWSDGGSNNRIIRNNITHNEKGILITLIKNSTIYNNNFVENSVHVEIFGNDPVTGNWDNGSQGNYWNDYTGVDNNGDGIGDFSYRITGNIRDNYPLIEPQIIPENNLNLFGFLILGIILLSIKLAFKKVK
jgi:parallel beta-helix repeat protein